MKWLKYTQCESWLAPIRINPETRALTLPQRTSDVNLRLPRDPVQISYLAADLVEWFGFDSELLLWLTHWVVGVPGHIALMNMIRCGAGEMADIVDSPGAIIDKASRNDVDMTSGLLLLFITFNWECYLLGDQKEEYIYIGDGYLVLSTPERKKADATLQLASKYNLERILGFPGAPQP